MPRLLFYRPATRRAAGGMGAGSPFCFTPVTGVAFYFMAHCPRRPPGQRPQQQHFFCHGRPPGICSFVATCPPGDAGFYRQNGTPCSICRYLQRAVMAIPPALPLALGPHRNTKKRKKMGRPRCTVSALPYFYEKPLIPAPKWRCPPIWRQSPHTALWTAFLLKTAATTTPKKCCTTQWWVPPQWRCPTAQTHS